MLVHRKMLPSIAATLKARGAEIALDTETTGLRPWQGDRLFSLILANDQDAFYLNFQQYPGLHPDFVLQKHELQLLNELWLDPSLTWFMHNAKFDMGMLSQDGVPDLTGTIHCTNAIARVERNNRLNLSLAALAAEIGLEKSGAVDEFIAEHGLFHVEVNEEGDREKIPHFHEVPLEIIQPYGEQDAKITWKLGRHQIQRIEEMHARAKNQERSPLRIMQSERAVTKVFFKMERVGAQVDLDYSRKGAEFERQRMQEAIREFYELTGMEFVDGPKVLTAAFEKLGLPYPKTAKGNPSFKGDMLRKLKSPLAECILKYRDASKRRGTYYLNFIKFADSSGAIHSNVRQAGTETGRVSYADPNLQNLPKRREGKGEGTMKVRRAFTPRPGFFLAMLDYDQMEYRLMLDMCGELGLIAEIVGGMDVHEATGHMMGVEREPAKTINFGLLYGQGAQKLADGLGKTLREANLLKQLYFRKLPRVRQFIQEIQRVAVTRGYVINWAGRYNHCGNPEWAYAMPNHLIQGGCADVVKFAMVALDAFLTGGGYKSRMILQVHDEIVFEIADDEAHILPTLKQIMESVYQPKNGLPMTVGVDISRVSWADKEEWNGQAAS